MTPITVILPYYKNRLMLEKQVERFNSYPEGMRHNMGLILVDDGSPIGYRAEEVIAPIGPPKVAFRLFRILADLIWNWEEAKNIGAHFSDGWMLHTDMDHLIPPELLDWAMTFPLSPGTYYTFDRVKFKTQEPYKPHQNSALIHHTDYWASGGYDESWSGRYYGDSEFFRRLDTVANHVHVTEVHLELVGLDSVPDAKTDGPRRESFEECCVEEIQAWKIAYHKGVETLKLPFKEVVRISPTAVPASPADTTLGPQSVPAHS